MFLLINRANSATGWNDSAGAMTLDTEVKKEGSASVNGEMRAASSTNSYTGSSVNMTGQHVRMWWNFAALAFMDTFANDGLQFYMVGGSTAYWTIAGVDTYGGGWDNLVLDCDSSPTSGSFTKTAVTEWGLSWNRTAQPKKADNMWLDYLRYGDGYSVTGGTSGDEITLQLVEAADFIQMIEKRQGIKISAPEEIAYLNKWIDKETLLASAKKYGKSPNTKQ